MGKLIYWSNASLDGYIEDATGSFDWSPPTDEVHAFINDRFRAVGTHLYGRKLYEVMQVWETDPSLAEASDVGRDFAQIWQSADKVVYSTTLDSPTTVKTRIERTFDPVAVRRMKEAQAADLFVGGAALASHAIKAGLVDEYHWLLLPVLVGGGKRALPDNIHSSLELIEVRQFDNGSVYVRYRNIGHS
jgi:dihydrofolate reductase